MCDFVMHNDAVFLALAWFLQKFDPFSPNSNFTIFGFFGQKMASFVSIQEKVETSPNGIIIDQRVPKWGYLHAIEFWLQKIN